MKKETIFKYELNESIQANAAMNCLKNRNNREQLNETTEDKNSIAREVVFSTGREIPDEHMENPTWWFCKKIQERIGKQFLGMPKKELNAWRKAINAAISEWEEYESAQDQEVVQNNLADAWDEGMEEDDYVPYENKFDETHNDIVDTILEEVYRYFQFETDVEGFNLTEYTEEQIGKALEQILDKTNDFPSSVSNNVCYAWVKKHAGEIIKALENGSLENPYEGHPELDFSEQEEMEVTDAKHALAEMVADELNYADGNLDKIYNIVSDIIAEEGYSPEPDDYDEWLDEHFDEIQSSIN